MPANGSAGNVTGIPTTATVTETDTVTFVLVSVTTAVTTAPGQTVGFTTIITATATTSAVVAQGSNGSFGFSPINSALSVYSIPFIVSVITSMLVVLSVTFPP
ncbi:hypothetical protein DENSPDRAFT_833402 [Dentipellis sp. KUC8613]|nr:hypothetical protein DENSPDRAFT_833402 [Dentipellis sp. KUC8613]